MSRYSVGKHPDQRGYAIFDSVPRFEKSADIEGVGLVTWNEPKKLPPYFGFYKKKEEAEKRCAEFNKWESTKTGV